MGGPSLEEGGFVARLSQIQGSDFALSKSDFSKFADMSTDAYNILGWFTVFYCCTSAVIMITMAAMFGGDQIAGGTSVGLFSSYKMMPFLGGVIPAIVAIIAAGIAVLRSMKLRVISFAVLLVAGLIGISLGSILILATNAGNSWLQTFLAPDFLYSALDDTKTLLEETNSGSHEMFGSVTEDLDSLFGTTPANAGTYLVQYVNDRDQLDTLYTQLSAAGFDGGIYCTDDTTTARDNFHTYYRDGCPVPGSSYFPVATYDSSCLLASLLCRINVDLHLKNLQWQAGVTVVTIGSINAFMAFLLFVLATKFYDKRTMTKEEVKAMLNARHGGYGNKLEPVDDPHTFNYGDMEELDPDDIATGYDMEENAGLLFAGPKVANPARRSTAHAHSASPRTSRTYDPSASSAAKSENTLKAPKEKKKKKKRKSTAVAAVMIEEDPSMDPSDDGGAAPEGFGYGEAFGFD